MINTIRDFESLLNIAALFLSLLGLALIAWLKSKFVDRAEYERAAELREKAEKATQATIDSLDRRLLMTEAALKHLPSAEQLHDLSLQLTEMRGKIENLSIKLDGTNQRIDHLNDVVQRHESIFAEGARTT